MGGVSERRGWYPNAHYELGNNFNCDVNLLVPMASIFFSIILQLIGCRFKEVGGGFAKK